jgi:hypothetical protein
MKAGDIVQLSPETCRAPMFRGCMLVVTEIKPWGVQGYVQGLGVDWEMGGLAYYRAKHEEFEDTGGRAVWVPAGDES